MTRTSVGEGRHSGRLSEDQWHDLMRSLIEDVDAPKDDAAENSLLQEVAGRDYDDTWQ